MRLTISLLFLGAVFSLGLIALLTVASRYRDTASQRMVYINKNREEGTASVRQQPSLLSTVKEGYHNIISISREAGGRGGDGAGAKEDVKDPIAAELDLENFNHTWKDCSKYR